MSPYVVKVPNRFWQTALALKPKYTKEQYAEIISIIQDCIRELAEKGYVDENGWAEHLLIKQPFSDGCHFEFHIYDDDVLIIYFKRESKRVIRMVGVYNHENIPG